MNDPELKNCPFCGGKARFHACATLVNRKMAAKYKGKYGVHCMVCYVATLPMDGKEAAAGAWNRRTANG